MKKIKGTKGPSHTKHSHNHMKNKYRQKGKGKFQTLMMIRHPNRNLIQVLNHPIHLPPQLNIIYSQENSKKTLGHLCTTLNTKILISDDYLGRKQK